MGTKYFANKRTILCATYIRETHKVCDIPSSIQHISSACRKLLPTVILRLAIRKMLNNVLFAAMRCHFTRGLCKSILVEGIMTFIGLDISLSLSLRFTPLILLNYYFFLSSVLYFLLFRVTGGCMTQS